MRRPDGKGSVMQTTRDGRAREPFEGPSSGGMARGGGPFHALDARIVPVRAVRGSPLTAWACALPLGFLSGAVGVVTLALLLLDPRELTPPGWALASIFGATWLASTWWLARGHGRVISVLGRGLRLGSVEWALLGVALARLGPREAARALDGLHVALGFELPVPGHETSLVLATLCLVAVLAGSVLPRTLPGPLREEADGISRQFADAG